MEKHSSKLSANLGFLWQEHDLIQGIRAAAKVGFEAVECHWPYAYSSQIILDVLTETGLTMICLNTSPGNREQGDFGMCADPNRVSEARESIDQAIEFAAKINTPNVHVMSGKVSANIDQTHTKHVFQDNLIYAASKAESYGINILIEPINRFDVADYFVGDIFIAENIIKSIDLPNVKIMFDCYHIQKIHGGLKQHLEKNINHIGHLQIASFPNRQEPDTGEIDYIDLFSYIKKIGYDAYIGAEYNPKTTTDEGLSWMKKLS